MNFKNKSAQGTVSMPFKTIFAIFLIIVFVVFAFMAVRGFLDIGSTAGVGLFYDELQGAVNDAMRSQSSETNFEMNLPKGITTVCFANLSGTITAQGEFYDQMKDFYIYEANTFLLPVDKAAGMEWKLIENINITKITSEKNPYCVDAKKQLRLKKDFYDRYVTIE